MEGRRNHQVKKLANFCFGNNISVAAICDATIFLGNYRFLDQHKHTGNSLSYLKAEAPNYRGAKKYINEQSVSDGSLLTANRSELSSLLTFSFDISYSFFLKIRNH
jgi:putative intracellular protease/amidase